MDACLLKVMLEAAAYSQNLWCVSSYSLACAHALWQGPAGHLAVLVKGANKVSVQVLIGVELLHIACSKSKFIPGMGMNMDAACTTSWWVLWPVLDRRELPRDTGM
jgi:hypothetical protein